MKNSLKTIGSTSLAKNSQRVNNPEDYYGTDPKSTLALLRNEKFDHNIWEPCAGHHLIVDQLEYAGYDVYTSDIAEYDSYEHDIVDFLATDLEWDGDIITNPPYNLAGEFAEKAINIVKSGHKVAMFLRLLFLEGSARYEKIFKENPPKTIYIFSNRQVCSKNDNFSEGSAVAYCWIVWEKGFKGDPAIKWVKTN